MVKHTQTISRFLPTNCLSVFHQWGWHLRVNLSVSLKEKPDRKKENKNLDLGLSPPNDANVSPKAFPMIIADEVS